MQVKNVNNVYWEVCKCNLKWDGGITGTSLVETLSLSDSME